MAQQMAIRDQEFGQIVSLSIYVWVHEMTSLQDPG